MPRQLIHDNHSFVTFTEVIDIGADIDNLVHRFHETGHLQGFFWPTMPCTLAF